MNWYNKIKKAQQEYYDWGNELVHFPVNDLVNYVKMRINGDNTIIDKNITNRDNIHKIEEFIVDFMNINNIAGIGVDEAFDRMKSTEEWNNQSNTLKISQDFNLMTNYVYTELRKIEKLKNIKINIFNPTPEQEQIINKIIREYIIKNQIQMNVEEAKDVIKGIFLRASSNNEFIK